MLTRKLSISLTVALLLAVAGYALEPSPVPRGRSLMSQVVLVKAGRPAAAIAVADDEQHRTLAAQVQDAIKQATGAQLPIISDTEAAANIGSGNLVVIGNLMTNKVAERLYHNYYIASDAAQPGPGRYEFRTVH
ncbi:unnamed protein product, partial [marine sediment metagenome]